MDADTIQWQDFARDVRRTEREDFRNGLSYIISGSLALVGGLAGSGITHDPVERGIYTFFQTIGIASIGYGAYTWRIGGEERSLYTTLQQSHLTPEQRTNFLRAHALQKRTRDRRERIIKAVTHGLIAGLNIYNATQQQQDSIKTGLYFIGGVNLLAAISYTFEF